MDFLFQLDWSTSESATVSMEKLLNAVNILGLLAGICTGELAGMSFVSGVLSIVNLVAGGILYTWAAWYNQMLAVLSQIRLTQGVSITFSESEQRNLIKYGALQAGDALTLSLVANNTGHKKCTILDSDVLYWINWAGDGGDFIYHSRAAISASGEMPTIWTAEKSSTVPAAFTIIKNGLLTRDTPGGSVTHAETFILPASNDLRVYYETSYTPEQGDPTSPEIQCISLAETGLHITEPTLAQFLDHCVPSERAIVEEKAWEFLQAAWEGRFKDASNVVEQAIVAVEFTPEQFNALFASAIPHYNGTEHVTGWGRLGIDFCPDCNGFFNATVGVCPRCGWTLDHYGVNVTRYDGPGGWHDLVTRYFAEGFRAISPASGSPYLTPTVEWQASAEAYFNSQGMLLVPAAWVARKNQSMSLLQALWTGRGSLPLLSNLDVIPQWNGTLEVPAQGTCQTSLLFTIDGPDNPLTRVEVGCSPAFTSTLLSGGGTCYLQDFPTITLDLRPAGLEVPAGFYTAQLNLTFANDTVIAGCTIPFYYRHNRSLDLDLLMLPEIITLGDTVTWGQVRNQGTVPETLLLETDGLPAEWVQGTLSNADGFYAETIDPRETSSYSEIARLGFEAGTSGWAGSFASGQATFTRFLRTYNAAFVDMNPCGTVWVPPTGDGFVIGPGTYIPARDANFDRDPYLVASATRWTFLQVPGFLGGDPLAGMIPANSSFKLGLTTTGFNPITPLELFPCGQFNEGTITGNTIPAIDWGARREGPKPATVPADVRISDLAPGYYLLRGEAYAFISDERDPALGCTYTFEKFGARQGTLLFQTDVADSFTARKVLAGISLRAGDRVRVTYDTTATTPMTVRVGSIPFAFLPGTGESTFLLPLGMESPTLEIAGTLGAGEFLHVSAITVERPAQVLDYACGRREVLALGAGSGGSITAVTYPINPIVLGTVEMWVLGTNWTAPLRVEMRGATSSVWVGIEHQQVRAWDGVTVKPIANLSLATGWTHLRFEFSYMTCSCAVWVNNAPVARGLPLNLTGMPLPLDHLCLETAPGTHTYFVDAIACTGTGHGYVTGDNLGAMPVNGSEKMFVLAPGTSRDFTITIPRHFSVPPGTRQLCAKLVDPVTRQLLAVAVREVRVGAFYDLGLDVRPLQDTTIPACNFAISVTNLGNVRQVVTLGCEGDALGEWTFETSMKALDPGQSFTTTLTFTTAPLPPGAHAFSVTATTAANQTSAGVTYYIVDDVVGPAPGDTDATGGQVLDGASGIAVEGGLMGAGIIVGMGIVTRKRKKSRNLVVASLT